MNSSQPLLRRLLIHRPLHLTTTNNNIITTTPHIHGCHYYSSTPTPCALKAGTPIPGLSTILPPSKDPSKDTTPTAKPRSEYPSWVSDLAKSPPTLAKLRNMKMEEASDQDMRRYLKLMRRNLIKDNNAIAGI